MRIKVSKTDCRLDFESIEPSFIYNRFDMFLNTGEFEAVCIRCGKKKKVVEYRIYENQAELGLWLVPITTEELEALISYIVSNHPHVSRITYKNGVLPYGKSKQHNHFKVLFPENVDEFKKRISPKVRQEMRRRNRRAEEAYGQMQILEYERSEIPFDIVESYFNFKSLIRNRNYGMTPEEYLDKYHVSTCYVVKFGETIGAILFSCEQLPFVNGENFTYNPELRKYSVGQFINAYSLCRMVEKGHSGIFMSGGSYEYKTHYGSIEETLYDCTIKVSDLDLAAIAAKQGFDDRLRRGLKNLRTKKQA